MDGGEFPPGCAANCGDDLDGEFCAKIISVCPSGHLMHSQCVLRMYETVDNPCCPMCRDDTLSLLKDMIVKNPHITSSDDDDDDDDDGDGAAASETRVTYHVNFSRGGTFVVDLRG